MYHGINVITHNDLYNGMYLACLTLKEYLLMWALGISLGTQYITR
jgi:hypothetical protein